MTDHADLEAKAKRHLWMHFTRLGAFADRDIPVIVRGEGATCGTTRAGATWTRCRACSSCRSATGAPSSPRPPRAQAASSPTSRSGATRTRTAIELAATLAELAPGDLDRVFFTSWWVRGGRVGVEARPPVLQARSASRSATR